MARAAALKAALLLTTELGGTSVYVPRRPKAGTLLVGAVGLEVARAIATLWPGENVEIPLGPSAKCGDSIIISPGPLIPSLDDNDLFHRAIPFAR